MLMVTMKRAHDNYLAIYIGYIGVKIKKNEMKKYMLILACLGFLCSCDPDSTDSSGNSNGTGGSMARFTCKGNYLYVVDDVCLQTFDISDSSKITLKSRIQVGGTMETIFPADTLLFLGSTSGMFVYNLKNPSAPQFVSEYIHFTSCDPVVVQGKYAFVTLHSADNIWSCSRNVNELQVIDISNIRFPEEKVKYVMTSPKGLAIDGDLLFVCDGMNIVVMDARDPLKMTILNNFKLEGVPYDLIAKNGLLTVSYSAGVKQYRYDGNAIQLLSSLY